MISSSEGLRRNGDSALGSDDCGAVRRDRVGRLRNAATRAILTLPASRGNPLVALRRARRCRMLSQRGRVARFVAPLMPAGAGDRASPATV
ncbi:hypothetical protein CKO25_08715 [Thiocapsa imhoffii]|uniref:Uncharacterized protein n=1 Tax=Thiocapsa imhoffii TaxID=382777 RepID=A0A9X0WHC7_9GAMM|nr:hypothetical protein [Thiocapsa imhoffii]